MKKGICFYFGYKSDPKERIKLLKKYGFDCVIANADKKFDHQNGSIKSQVKLFKEHGIELSSLHMQYNSSDLPYFWQDGKFGDELTNKLIKDVKIASKYGFSCVVVHIQGTPSQIGFERLRKVLRYCEKYDTPLAIENLTKNKDCFIATFDNINHPYLKFCFDIGHQNLTKDYFISLEPYFDKLICLHLHSNMGDADSHTLNKYGNIDWNSFAKKLATLDRPINLDYEVLMLKRENETEEDVARECIEQAKQLESLINKYKEKNRSK